MWIEVRTKINVDTQKWAELFDTTGMKASDVRKDFRKWAKATLLDEAEALGVLEGAVDDEYGTDLDDEAVTKNPD